MCNLHIIWQQHMFNWEIIKSLSFVLYYVDFNWQDSNLFDTFSRKINLKFHFSIRNAIAIVIKLSTVQTLEILTRMHYKLQKMLETFNRLYHAILPDFFQLKFCHFNTKLIYIIQNWLHWKMKIKFEQ